MFSLIFCDESLEGFYLCLADSSLSCSSQVNCLLYVESTLNFTVYIAVISILLILYLFTYLLTACFYARLLAFPFESRSQFFVFCFSLIYSAVENPFFPAQLIFLCSAPWPALMTIFAL